VFTRCTSDRLSPAGLTCGSAPAWCLLLLFVAASSPAQQLHIRTFTPDEGLPASQTWAVYQDHIGYLWFGTAAGLSRYDGTSFSDVSVADGLPDPLVRTISQSRDGRLWFGTNAGVASFDGRTLQRYGERDGVGKGTIWASTVDARGNVWVGTQDGGLSVFDGKTFRTFTERDGLPSNYVYSLLCAHDGTIWMGTRAHGVARFTPGPHGEPAALQAYTTADGLPHDAVRAIAEDRSGNLYFGTRGGGLARFDGRRFQTIASRAGLEGKDVYALIVNHRGELVVGTVDAGVSICDLPDLHRCRTVTERNGLNVDNVYALFEDREHNLWIGLNNGVSQLVTESFQGYSKDEGLPDNGVHAVFPEKNGDVWLGTYGGLARGRRDPSSGAFRFRTFTTKDGLASDGVWDVLRDRAGTLWVATRSGLCHLRSDGRFETLTQADGLPSNYIYDLFEARNGDLWMATLEGVSRWTGHDRAQRPAFENYTVKSGLSGSQIYTIAEDGGGKIWIGTAGQGIDVFDGSAFHHYTTAHGLGSNSINAISITGDGTVWVGTGGGGLARFNRGASAGQAAFARFGPEAGLRSDSVVAITEGADGLLWLGTSRGVDLFDPHHRRPDGQQGEVIRHFDKRSGLISNELLTSNAIARASDGTLWFGFSDGVTHYHPSLDWPEVTPPNVVMKRVVVGGRRAYYSPFAAVASAPRRNVEWLSSGALAVAPDENSIHFAFRALSFKGPETLGYEYQLVGFDPDWLEETSIPFKEYTNLSPGRYTFRIRARVPEGKWGPTAEVRLVVHPHLWQTWWARIAIATLGLLGMLALHKMRTRRMRQRHRELEAIIDQRTRELAEHAAELEVANRGIQAADRTKSRFLAAMSHELRTPLNAIIGFSEVLIARFRDRADLREQKFLQNIYESGQHLLNLINNILDLSKVEAGRMDLNEEDFAIEPVIEQVEAVVTDIASRRRIEIVTRRGEALPPVRADQSKLRQILFNLLSNAIKFSNDGQIVELETRFRPAAESPLRLDSVEIAIIDHGIGISAEEQKLLFQEFRQAEGGITRGGTGLGLALVRKLTELQQGVVTFDSIHGRGSTFRVVLPAAVREGGAEVRKRHASEAGTSS